jgi:adenylate cyclase
MEFGLLTILVIFGISVLLSYFRLTHSREKMIAIFGQYVPPQLAAEIARHPERVSLDGESRRLTVFFCDLQQFSGVAEQLNPKQLAALLNEYFTEMTDVLYRHGATIDKYIGDSIMAFWGAPLPVSDHAHRAVLAAFEMHKVIEELVTRFVKRGWPAPALGIGINTGLMNVGNMGSKYRIAYTVVGDAVNLAARLESLTRTYHVPTIVGDTTRSECVGVVFRTLDIVQVRGKHNLTRIYQPLCLESELNDELRQKLEKHERAMELYLDGNHAEAIAALTQMKADWPEDDFYPAILRKLRHSGTTEPASAGGGNPGIQ